MTTVKICVVQMCFGIGRQKDGYNLLVLTLALVYLRLEGKAVIG